MIRNFPAREHAEARPVRKTRLGPLDDLFSDPANVAEFATHDHSADDLVDEVEGFIGTTDGYGNDELGHVLQHWASGEWFDPDNGAEILTRAFQAAFDIAAERSCGVSAVLVPLSLDRGSASVVVSPREVLVVIVSPTLPLPLDLPVGQAKMVFQPPADFEPIWHPDDPRVLTFNAETIQDSAFDVNEVISALGDEVPPFGL